jgi:hypothetical protein
MTRQPAFLTGLAFLRARWPLVLTLSLILLVPLFWHPRIEAGDLGSHTYNAWLAQLVASGQAPGLYLAPQWSHILVDLTLSSLGAKLGFIAAERIVVCFCVLCFFWGAFTLVAATSQHPPWFLVPAIAMIAYGYTFYAGFMNFYLSIAFAFWAAAVAWRATRTDWPLVAILAVLAFAAHPMGFAIFAGLVAYVELAKAPPGWGRWALAFTAVAFLIGLRFYFLRFRTQPGPGFHRLFLTGPDQLVVFGSQYRPVSYAFFALLLLWFLVAVIRDPNRSGFFSRAWMPLTLWFLLIFATILFPWVIWFPQYIAPFSAIFPRLTAVTAVVGFCVLGSLQPSKLVLSALVACAIVFFILQYRDTAVLNHMEQQAEVLVSQLPYGHRVSYTLNLKDDCRVNFRHMIDRACIGHCFTYSNYEPGTGQFRVRLSHQGSPLVSHSGLALELGEYIVRPSDLPMAQIYQPDESDLTKLAIRELVAGEKNGRIGHHPPLEEIQARLPLTAQ